MNRQIISMCLAVGVLIGALSAKTAVEPSWVDLGRAKRLMAEGSNGIALKLLHDVIGRESNNADAHYLLGELYRFEKKYDTAIVHYRATIKYSPLLSVPSQGIDSYFNILLCFTNNDMTIREREVSNIMQLAEKRKDPVILWRLHYFLGDYYERTLQNEIRAIYHYTNADAISWMNADRIANYSKDALIERSGERQALYRAASTELPSQRMLMYRISQVYRRGQKPFDEKRYLLRARDYEFIERTKETAKVDAAIEKRLAELSTLRILRPERSE